MNTEDAATVRRLAEKTWRCGVFDSGAHNGSTCKPGEVHGGWWRCGYYYVLKVPAEVIDGAPVA